MGASYLAGLAVGFWSSKDDVIKNWALDKEFEPAMDEATRAAEIKQWKKAVSKTLGWAKD
jgi:glycerol kinase